MTTNTKQTPEQMMRSARRYTTGLALLNDPAYTFRRFDGETPIWHVHNGRGDVYVTDLVWDKCTCADFQKHEEACKHMYSCLELRNREQQAARCDELAELAANAEDAEWGCSPL